MNASNVKGNPLKFLPKEVIDAALVLAEYQEKTGNQINFGAIGPYSASMFVPASPRTVFIKIENVSAKTVRKLVKDCEGLELAHIRSGYPEIYLHNCKTEKATFTLHISGDREKNIKETIAREAQKNGKASAEWVAQSLMQQYGLDTTGE